jgi:hypothetical protein
MYENLKVYAHRRPNLRADEALIYLGLDVLSDLFDHPDKDLSHIESVVLQFPERWLNILEQRALLEALRTRCPNLTSVRINTHSPYILQVVPNGCLFSVHEQEVYDEKPYSASVRYCHPTDIPFIGERND